MNRLRCVSAHTVLEHLSEYEPPRPPLPDYDAPFAPPLPADAVFVARVRAAIAEADEFARTTIR